MTSRLRRQRGFGVIEVVLGVVVVGVIGAAGWLAYRHYHQQPKTNTVGGTSSSSQTKEPTIKSQTQQGAVATTTTETIPELGIDITVPNAIKDLKYEAHTETLKNGAQGAYVLLTTTSLSTADAACAAADAPLGSLGRGDGQYPSDDPSAATDYGVLVKQFPTFYISYAAPQAGCSSNTSVQSAASTDKSNLTSSFSTIQQSS